MKLINPQQTTQKKREIKKISNEITNLGRDPIDIKEKIEKLCLLIQ